MNLNTMTKFLSTIILFSVFVGNVYSQTRQASPTDPYMPIIPIERQNLLKNVDIIANMNFNFRSDFLNGEMTQSKFRFEQFRLEIMGYVSKKVYFRFRHRYTSDFEPQSIDKIVKGVDFAYLRIDLTEKTQLMVGKMYADWGGWEFDINPIDIYDYSDIIEYADNFLSGVGITQDLTTNHALTFQVLDSRTSTFDDIYDTIPNVTSSKIPLAFVINWRGKLFNGKVTTLWSYSLFNEAKGIFKNYIALGQQYDGEKFHLAYDYKISVEDLDRTGLISNEIPDNLYNYSVEKTLYRSHWLRATYDITKRWHVSFTGFIDFADWKSDLDPLKTEDRFRTRYSFTPTLELFPWDDVNLKFFVGYVGNYYKYSDYAKTRPGLDKVDYNTGRIMLGFISPLLIL